MILSNCEKSAGDDESDLVDTVTNSLNTGVQTIRNGLNTGVQAITPGKQAKSGDRLFNINKIKKGNFNKNDYINHHDPQAYSKLPTNLTDIQKNALYTRPTQGNTLGKYGKKIDNSGCGLNSFLYITSVINKGVIPPEEIKKAIEEYNKYDSKLPDLKPYLEKCAKNEVAKTVGIPLVQNFLPLIFKQVGMGLTPKDLSCFIPNSKVIKTNDINVAKTKINKTLKTGKVLALINGQHYVALDKNKNGDPIIVDTDNKVKPLNMAKHLNDMSNLNISFYKQKINEHSSTIPNLDQYFDIDQLAIQTGEILKDHLKEGYKYIFISCS